MTRLQLREWFDFSQQYMAIQLGITQSHYSKIERGEFVVLCRRMEQIADIFGTSVEELTNNRFAQIPFEK
ncbi:MAG: helix-turn-helix domain-containing protein [Spirosomataceae bacterium]